MDLNDPFTEVWDVQIELNNELDIGGIYFARRRPPDYIEIPKLVVFCHPLLVLFDESLDRSSLLWCQFAIRGILFPVNVATFPSI